ncbi:hypothetical protein LTR84_002491 [Exophiala bonariae]|uniref:Uncharacterized protein n=1 Tax=Exophiala bonariae TaxID=1690606 RepID=A0AAV9NDD5_9EURO|nr:hypothetical protein LTR84_002491 [Exophiala bonariae]
MSESKLYNRSWQRRSAATLEKHDRPYKFDRSKLRPRQITQKPDDPELSFDGDETSSDESGEDGESDSEGEDDSSDDEEENENANPFASRQTSGTATRATLSTTGTTTITGNPFAIVTATPTSGASTTMVTANPTSQNFVQSTATAGAQADSEMSSVSRGGENHTTAIALGSVLGVLSVVIGAYLLFRFCAPVKARVASFRGRRGTRLLGEEGGMPQGQLGGGMVQSGEFAAMNRFRYSKAASSIATPAPSYTRDIAVAMPITSARAPAPISIHSASRDDDTNNPFSDRARSMSRNNSQRSYRSQQRSIRNSGASDYDNPRPTTDMLGEQGTYAFNFSFDDYRNSGTEIGPTRLTNSTPPATSGRGANSRSNSVKRSIAPYPPGLGPGLGIESIPYASPSEVATPRTQYMPRQRYSVTPSESVSNAPYSPLPFPAGLMPVNSRWSKNSSSVWAKPTEVSQADLPAVPTRVVSRPPPLPLSVRSSTSSLSSQLSKGSRRSPQETSAPEPDQSPIDKRSTLELPSVPRSKTGSTIIGLPSSVRPVSNASSGVTLKPLAYHP